MLLNMIFFFGSEDSNLLYTQENTNTLYVLGITHTRSMLNHYKQYIHLFRIVTALPFAVFQWTTPSVASCVTTKLQLLSHVVQL